MDQLFPELLKGSPYITQDPEEADFFFADAWIFWPHATNHMDGIVAAIREKLKAPGLIARMQVTTSLSSRVSEAGRGATHTSILRILHMAHRCKLETPDGVPERPR